MLDATRNVLPELERQYVEAISTDSPDARNRAEQLAAVLNGPGYNSPWRFMCKPHRNREALRLVRETIARMKAAIDPAGRETLQAAYKRLDLAKAALESAKIEVANATRNLEVLRGDAHSEYSDEVYVKSILGEALNQPAVAVAAEAELAGVGIEIPNHVAYFRNREVVGA